MERRVVGHERDAVSFDRVSDQDGRSVVGVAEVVAVGVAVDVVVVVVVDGVVIVVVALVVVVVVSVV